MERGSVSPTPVGRTMKRLRQGREAAEPSESREEQGNQGQADLGVLLGPSKSLTRIITLANPIVVASLPSSTHLQILHSLIASHPQLKPVIHALIPPPEVSFAIQVLDEKLERLVEAVPIGAHPVASTSSTQPSRPVAASFGFGSTRATATNGTVSDGYILNRLRIPLTEFTNVALTYLPYFITPRQTDKPPSSPTHPSISFQYLSHLTTLIITRIFPLIPASALHPPTSSNLAPLDTLLAALEDAWDSWLAQVSEHVNAQAGMYAASMAQSWINGIESLAAQAERAALRSTSKPPSGMGTSVPQGKNAVETLARGLRHLAREWVRQVGWLIGRSVAPTGEEGMSDRMDE